MSAENYPVRFLKEVSAVAEKLNPNQIDKMIEALINLRANNGRLFFLGVGGSAANCTHAVNDFRKIANIESYSATDNVAELTARTNDEGWEHTFRDWLKVSKLNSNDALFVLSVGGGNKEKNVSVNIVNAIEYAKEKNAKIFGILGRDGGFTAKHATACVMIPVISADTITPLSEAWQAMVWHLIVSDPRIQKMSNKWESLEKKM